MQTVDPRRNDECGESADNRFRLISLGEIMQVLFASRLVVAGSNLFNLGGPSIVSEAVSNVFPSEAFGKQIIDQAYLDDVYKPVLSELRADCISLDLGQSIKGIDFLLRRVSQQNLSHDDGRALADEISRRIRDELDSKLFLQVEATNAAFYEQPWAGWEAVLANFGKCAVDIEEATKCLALNRHTAAVFHLMRIMEVGLRALGASLNDERFDPRRNPSWDAILKKCDEELLKPLAQRSAEWRIDELFYSGAAARLRAVKDAWRNPTMHVEIVYTEETALDVYLHVRAFMRHLATKLEETVSS